MPWTLTGCAPSRIFPGAALGVPGTGPAASLGGAHGDGPCDQAAKGM